MDHPHSPDGDDLAGPASGPRERTIAELYAEHWAYVLELLPSFGVSAQDAEDVAQTAWMHVHRRRDSYDAATHKTRRAWITGFVQRCAANHRRTQRRERAALEEPGDQVSASGLDPEQATILRDLHRMIPNDEQREALLLQVRHGLSIAEIAAVQEVTESAVGWRLGMARKALKSGDDTKKSRAFLGFGSLEALTEALKPRPIPPEVGERQWQEIEERIRQEEASSPRDTDAPPPSSSQPTAAALPTQASPTAPALGALSTARLGIVLSLAFVGGSGVVAWRADAATGHGPATAVMDAATVPSSIASVTAAPPTSIRSTASSAAPSSSTTSSAASSTNSTPSTSVRLAVAPPTSSTSTAPPSTSSTVANAASSTSSAASTSAPGAESQRLLARMREAMRGRQFFTVLTLAAQHAQQFGATNVREREALRIEALRQTGRTKDATQHARAVLAAYPEHRRAMERAAGQALP